MNAFACPTCRHPLTEALALVVLLDAGTVHADGRIVRLSPIEYGFLERLARRPGKLVRRDDLIASVWGAEPPLYPRVRLNQTVRRLHGKLGAGLIENVPALGFRLTAHADDLRAARVRVETE